MTSTFPAENPFNHALHILIPPLWIILLLSSYYTCISNYYRFPLRYAVSHQLITVNWQKINQR